VSPGRSQNEKQYPPSLRAGKTVLWDKGNQDKNQNPCSYESLNQPRTISWRVDLARRFAGNKTILLRIGDVGCSKRPGKGNSC